MVAAGTKLLEVNQFLFFEFSTEMTCCLAGDFCYSH